MCKLMNQFKLSLTQVSKQKNLMLVDILLLSLGEHTTSHFSLLANIDDYLFAVKKL